MKRAAILTLLIIAVACTEKDHKPLSEPGERLYDMRGKIVSRSAPPENSIKVDHEAIPGFMEAMTMDYNVRGADVKSLPADNHPIQAKLHVTDNSYWLTDVRSIP